jgi:hypothetical protein
MMEMPYPLVNENQATAARSCLATSLLPSRSPQKVTPAGIAWRTKAASPEVGFRTTALVAIAMLLRRAPSKGRPRVSRCVLTSFLVFRPGLELERKALFWQGPGARGAVNHWRP